jgi:hypothetical protein
MSSYPPIDAQDIPAVTVTVPAVTAPIITAPVVPPVQYDEYYQPGRYTFSDPSAPIFSMYLRTSEEEDNKMADQLDRDAGGILIFVSTHIGFLYHLAATNLNILDWFIVCRCLCICQCVDTGLEAKSTGHLCILSREHPSTSRQPERISCIDPCHFN